MCGVGRKAISRKGAKPPRTATALVHRFTGSVDNVGIAFEPPQGALWISPARERGDAPPPAGQSPRRGRHTGKYAAPFGGSTQLAHVLSAPLSFSPPLRAELIHAAPFGGSLLAMHILTAAYACSQRAPFIFSALTGGANPCRPLWGLDGTANFFDGARFTHTRADNGAAAAPTYFFISCSSFWISRLYCPSFHCSVLHWRLSWAWRCLGMP